MDRDQTLRAILSDADRIRSFGVAALYLFGSVAREGAGPESDVDMFVDDDDRLDLFALAGLRQHLCGLLGRPIDIGTRNGLHAALRKRIEGEAIRVF